jgi:hypothetical protein
MCIGTKKEKALKVEHPTLVIAVRVLGLFFVLFWWWW